MKIWVNNSQIKPLINLLLYVRIYSFETRENTNYSFIQKLLRLLLNNKQNQNPLEILT